MTEKPSPSNRACAKHLDEMRVETGNKITQVHARYCRKCRQNEWASAKLRMVKYKCRKDIKFPKPEHEMSPLRKHKDDLVNAMAAGTGFSQFGMKSGPLMDMINSVTKRLAKGETEL